MAIYQLACFTDIFHFHYTVLEGLEVVDYYELEDDRSQILA